MAKIKPKTLDEIKKSLGRPVNLDTASKEDIFSYLKRLEKTTNSRIRRLRSKVEDSSTLKEMYRMLDFTIDQNPVTEAGYVNTKVGSLNDYKLIVRSMETFLGEKGSTITGIKEVANEFLGMFDKGLNYDGVYKGSADKDLIDKVVRAANLAATKNYDISDLYWVAVDIKKKGGDFNDFRREVDNTWLVDDALEDVLDVVWNSPGVQNTKKE